MDEKMTAIERLEEMLDAKDSEIEEMREELRKAEEKAEANHIWTKHVDYEKGKEPNPELPVPRLEMRWRESEHPTDGYTVEAAYSLVYRHLLGQVVFVPLGLTRSTGSIAKRVNDNGTIDTPFRDGAHFRNEMEQLGLPGFIIAGDVVRRVQLCQKCGRLDHCHRGDWRECDGSEPLKGYPKK